MSVRLDWQMEDEGGPPERKQRQWPVSSLLVLVAAALVLIGAFAAWQVAKRQAAAAEQRLIDTVQAVVDQERAAFLRGDGELFFAGQEEDASWIAAQLRPENQQVYRAGPTVTRAEQYGNDVWANISWPVEDGNWQRVAFFQWRNEVLWHVPWVEGHWGPIHRSREPWGELAVHEADQEWAGEIGAFLAETVSSICNGGASRCNSQTMPFTVTVADDYEVTAEPGELRLPSPRLLAMDEDGKPASLFWERLQLLVEEQLTTAAIRFAVPDDLVSKYERAAQSFMGGHEGIAVEVVSMADLSTDPKEWLEEVDGAAVVPTQELLAAGLVHDLTGFVGSDPDFDQADFYEQIWQGALWNGRVWMAPEAATMTVLFYDKMAYRRAVHPEPSLRWTWEEMAEDVSMLAGAQPDGADLTWGFLDTGLDSLFSFAYNWNNRCGEAAPVLCNDPLQAQNVAAALEWYGQMASVPGLMPDLTGLSDTERQTILLNWQTSRRKAAIWVDVPINYEHQLLLVPIGVVPFPGSDRFDGITPLRLQGSFISQQSEYPLATWQWLKYLTYEPPISRRVPARPSVAAGMQFWEILPPPLGDTMRTAFAFARPVSIEEQQLFSWRQLASVVSGELSAAQAAQSTMRLRWFDSP